MIQHDHDTTYATPTLASVMPLTLAELQQDQQAAAAKLAGENVAEGGSWRQHGRSQCTPSQPTPAGTARPTVVLFDLLPIPIVAAAAAAAEVMAAAPRRKPQQQRQERQEQNNDEKQAPRQQHCHLQSIPAGFHRSLSVGNMPPPSDARTQLAEVERRREDSGPVAGQDARWLQLPQ